MSYLLPSYFQNLGLDQTATERDVKRAYAAELRNIDQATQAAQFQQLRQDYEAALNHVKHGWVFAQIDAEYEVAIHVQPEAHVDVVEKSSTEVAQQALELLANELQHIAPSDDTAIEAKLKELLASPDLIGLQVRQDFEALLVKELAARQHTNSNRFGQCSFSLLLASDIVYGWSQTTRMATIGMVYLQTLLDEINERSEFDLAVLRKLCDHPNHNTFTYSYPSHIIENTTLVLLEFAYDDGHLEAWNDLVLAKPEKKSLIQSKYKFLVFLVWLTAVILFIGGKGLYPAFALGMTAVMTIVLAL